LHTQLAFEITFKTLTQCTQLIQVHSEYRTFK